MATKPALLVLADGRSFSGFSLGADGETAGEVVFNTSLTGYQEILTDPSYKGQIVTMTYPLIGNYGLNREDVESSRPFIEGLIVREASAYPSNWRSTESLDAYLKRHGIVSIQGVDTRALTLHLREQGAQVGVVSSVDLNPKSLRRKAREHPGLIGRDLVREVTSKAPYAWKEGLWEMGKGYPTPTARPSFKVVACDYGVKCNILRNLVSHGCDVHVVPAETTAATVLGMKPDGIFLSNGPGDPEGVPYAIEAVRNLLGKLPIFGICLGHQILGLAMGGKTYKLKYGHHGGNQPVKELATGHVEITAQNHGFAVDVDSLGGEVELTHVNLNDRTVEGMAHKTLPVFSVQYHPEASPGPHDAGYLFDRFIGLMKKARAKG